MADLSVNFIGLELKSPIIIASAGITETVDRMKKCQDYGAGAIIMKSYFEEVISRKSPTPRFKIIKHDLSKNKTFTLFSYEQASEWDINRYAQEVSDAKAKLEIKIIPSINCTTDEGWVESAKLLESAGADAIELNTSCPHGSITFRGKAVEETIFNSVRLVREAVRMPIIAKISPMLTSPLGVVKELENIGVDAVTIFNRMTALEIDIESETPALHGGYAGHGGPWAIQYPLRWISEIRPNVKIAISGSGGVSNWQDVVKYILAGANIVQVCTAVIMNGYEFIPELLNGLDSYMDRKGYKTVDDFRGNVCQKILGTKQIDRRKKAIAHIDYEKHVAPCVSACPAHVPAEAYIGLIAQGKFAKAAKIIRSKNPFQSICGYICYHPCEAECTRRFIDQPIAIRALKRFALEWAEKAGYPIMGDDTPINPPTDCKVAIIGSGPAGLTTAYELVKMGHSVTIFEADKEIGGKIRSEIPESKYPHAMLDREIEYIKNLGIKIELNATFGRDFTIKSLKEMGYKSILLAIGRNPNSIKKELKMTDQGVIYVDENTGLTSAEGVFSAGDAIHASKRSLIQVIADGKRSAYYMNLFLKNQPLELTPELIPVNKRSVLARSINEQESPRVDIPKIDGIEMTLTAEEAIKEASRCLACGCGLGCGKCHQVCIYSGIDPVSDRYFVNDQNCDGCGLCVEICPNEAIEMVPIQV